MKQRQLVGLVIVGLLVLIGFLISYFSVGQSAFQSESGQMTSPAAAATSATPIDLSRLHVAKISRVELHCGMAPSISPDNEHYVCAGEQDKPGLWLGSLGKGLGKRLAENGGLAAWLPDSKTVVYAEIVRDQPTVLYEVNVETGARARISSTKNPYDGDHLQILPDGRVVFLEKDALQVWDSKARTLKPLQAIGCIDPKTQSPFSSYYTAVSLDGEGVVEACAGSLYLIDGRTSKKITLSDQVGIFVKPAAWSPDGRLLAYSVQPDATRIAELWLANADGSNARRLLRDEQARAFEWLTWMPDGQTLLFIKNPGGGSFGRGYIYMAINVNGGPPKELFRNGESLQLFDNGRKLLISRSVEDSGEWIVELAW